MLNVLFVPLTRSYIVDFIDYIVDRVKEVLSKSTNNNVIVHVWPTPEKPPMRCYNWERMQYISSCIMEWLYNMFSNYTKQYIIVGIGYIDGYENGYNFIFGEAFPSIKICLVFTKRLSPIFYGKEMDYNLYVNRIIKEVIHEIGHILGLDHCSNKKCVMSFSNSIYEVDMKTRYFCNSCLLKIRNKYRKI